MLASFVACLALLTLYGSLRIAQAPDDSPVIGHVILVPNRLSVDVLKVQADPLLKQAQVQSAPETELSETELPWCCIVSPETSIFWNMDDTKESKQSASLQSELLDFTHRHKCDAIIGAWVTSATSSLNRNAVVVLRNGQVIAVVDKQQPVPFVEAHPFGTEWLQQAGLIPVVADRKVAPPIRPNIEVWSDQSIPWAVGVCYDIFFPGTFKQFGLSETGAIVCSLDETFDQNGVFRPLSAIHSRLRAVEFRRPVIRCSVGGHSGVYDSTGRLIDPQIRRGIVTLYEIRDTKRRTLYGRFGDWIPIACGLISIATIGMCAVNSRP